MPGTVDFTGFDYADVCYGTVDNMREYFAHKPQQIDDITGLPEEAQWKLLLQATIAIDRLLYRGYKTPVFNLIANAENTPSDAQIAAADATQPLQFPRDGEAAVPEDIVIAAYEEAQSLVARNADTEFENLSIGLSQIAGSSTSYGRYLGAQRHTANGITSFFAWTYLQPYLADVSTFVVKRV